jgi:hypothetical protein
VDADDRAEIGRERCDGFGIRMGRNGRLKRPVLPAWKGLAGVQSSM